MTTGDDAVTRGNAVAETASRGGGLIAVSNKWLPWVYLGMAAVLIPWDVHLAISLPRRSISAHYRLTWVGFDVLLIMVMARIGWCAHRRTPNVVLTFMVGATLLVTDAWFDVTTAATGSDRIQAVLSAVLLELPIAALCALLARRSLRTLVGSGPDNHRKP